MSLGYPDHHIISPSAMPRLENCIGSLYGAEPDRSSSPASREGTACHSLLEYCLSLGENPRHLLGWDGLSSEFPVNIEMIEGVELFITTIKALCDEHGIPHDRIMSERRLVHPMFKDHMFGGTVDCQVIGDDVLITADLKFGRKQVYADSSQLTAYSLLSLDNLPPEHARKIKKVIQLVIQPRANPQVSRHEVGSDELLALNQKIRSIEQYILAHPDLTQRATPEVLHAGTWCKFCPNRDGCPANRAQVEGLIQIGTFAAPEPNKYIACPTSDIPTTVLVEWHEKAEVVAEFAKDVAKALKVRALQGHEIPRHKIVVGYGKREFVGGFEEAVKRLPRAGLNLAKKDLYEQVPLSVAKVEKLLKEREVLKDKELKAKFETMVESTPTGVRLVSSKTRGEAVRPETAQEFLEALLSSKDSEETGSNE